MSTEPNFTLALPATVVDVDRIVGEIRKLAGGDDTRGMAHMKEDELHQAVLNAIAIGSWRDSPAHLCRAALKTRDIEFARWCA